MKFFKRVATTDWQLGLLFWLDRNSGHIMRYQPETISTARSKLRLASSTDDTLL